MSWWRKGVLNILEHAVTRGSDALITILLIRSLDATSFAKVALAQAWFAPVLLIFISPEVILYRDYASWKNQGRMFLYLRLKAFRRFGILKWAVASAIAAVAAYSSHLRAPDINPLILLSAWLWAAWLPLVPQVLGPDREFLRMSLQMRALNALTLFQKLTLLVGSLLIAWIWPEWTLPGAVVTLLVSVGLTWVFARLFTYFELSKIQELPQTKDLLPTLKGWAAITDALRGFSLWSHLSGVIQNWVQTMDMFFLGIFHATAGAQLALYAVALKLSGLLLALPMALANVFGVWVAQRARGTQALEIERDEVKRQSLRLYLVCIAQMMIFWALSSWIIDWLSRGRWNQLEQEQVFHWLVLISTGAMMYASTFLMSSWISLRQDIKKLLIQVYLPWGLISAAIYAYVARKWEFTEVAGANIAVSVVYVALLWRQWKYTGPKVT